MSWFWVALGGAIGAAGRYGMMVAIGKLWPAATLPYGTLTVNILGAGLMGVLIGALAHALPAHGATLRLFLAVGVLGGFTTFSTFALDVITLLERQDLSGTILYISCSVIGSMLALCLGLWCWR